MHSQINFWAVRLDGFFMHLKTPRYAGEFKKGEAVIIVTKHLSFA